LLREVVLGQFGTLYLHQGASERIFVQVKNKGKSGNYGGSVLAGNLKRNSQAYDEGSIPFTRSNPLPPKPF